MRMRLIEGEIRYLEREGGPEFGRERFTVSVFPDGSRTLRALCLYGKGLTRDVTYTVGADWRPREAFVRVALEDGPIGSAWFRFTDRTAEAEGFTRREGRFRQSIPVPERVLAFGSHPICSDIWRLAHVPTEAPGTRRVLENCMNSSAAAAGDTGPMLCPRSYAYTVAPEETVPGPDGPVTCHRYDWPVRPGKTLRMWTRAPDFLPYRMDCPETGQLYVLASLSDTG